MSAYRFLEPLDVLFLRGNKLFGDAGSHGEALMPPWPSVAAGALRSRMLQDAGVDFRAFAEGRAELPGIGSGPEPGPFRVSRFLPARRHGDGRVEAIHPLPADLIVSEDEDHRPQLHPLRPQRLDAAIATPWPLERLPLLAADRQSKPASGYWLDEAGWQAYLAGELPDAESLVKQDTLWKHEARLGIALDAGIGSVEKGRLYTAQAVAMNPDTGFLAVVEGAEPPADGLVRLGGDGRGAALSPAAEDALPRPDYAALAKAGRARLVLTSPGIFPDGWRLPGMSEDGRWRCGEVAARVVCAAVPRHGVISGWDLVKRHPKPAERTAPTGAVYWLEGLQATPQALETLAREGLWLESGPDPARRAEGFNGCEFTAWND